MARSVKGRAYKKSVPQAEGPEEHLFRLQCLFSLGFGSDLLGLIEHEGKSLAGHDAVLDVVHGAILIHGIGIM